MKFLISEEEKSRILEMHQNATSRQYLMEGVPNTTLVADSAIEVAARSICGGIDYVKASVILSNTGTEDAYINMRPSIKLGDGSDASLNSQIYTTSYNVTVKGKPVVGQADGQNQFKIPKGTKATLNIVMALRISNIESRYKGEMDVASRETSRSQREKLQAMAQTNRTTAYNKIKNLKSAVLNLRYNGQPIQISMNFGGFMIDSSRACDAAIELPKGF
jgi:hypothetical protein